MELKDENQGGFEVFKSLGTYLQCAKPQGGNHEARKEPTEFGAQIGSRLQNIQGPICNPQKFRTSCLQSMERSNQP